MIIEKNNLLQEHLVRRFETQNWRIIKSRQPKDIKPILKKYSVDVVLLSLKDLKNEGMVLIKKIKKNIPLFK